MQSTASDAPPTELLVCVKCRRGTDAPVDERRPGKVLYDDLTGRDGPADIRVAAVECLGNCNHGCTIALRGGTGKWAYVFGNVDEVSHPEAILAGAALYHASADGVIPWRERPEHFKRNCIARIPPFTSSEDA